MGCASSTVPAVGPANNNGRGHHSKTLQSRSTNGKTLLTSGSGDLPKNSFGNVVLPDPAPNGNDASPRPAANGGGKSPGKSILRTRSAHNMPTRPAGHASPPSPNPSPRGAAAASESQTVSRNVKRRVTFGHAEAREFRVQLTHSQSF
eukprot:TRINITY_DN5340_c0_g1_i1.p1 TRINITY_DN5340_c0_g1~~TRINITY_DN5340_c0_g1_i1.p1  ORF type:complete len:148 (+),score=22.69 TRINITY_DN5340_c0_g1_i1:164-607(+)